jgi:hydroxymethylpyrimidine pyrophosphatase-like HAD family hydrolase
MSSGTLPVQSRPAAGEEFYSAYAWCLDPVPSLGDLLRRLGEDLERYETRREGWEREECRINLYLFACAIACTVDDYLASRPCDLGTLAARFPAWRRAVTAADATLNFPHRLRSRFRDRRVIAWRCGWGECVDAACEALLGGDQRRLVELARRGLAAAALPPALLARRMRIPEGFRCQDLTHHDVCAMAERAGASLGKKGRPAMIVGPRTAGGYFAPLAAAFLRKTGHRRVRWITVRPRSGLLPAERRAIAASIAEGAALLIIDDHPNTGNTLRLLIGTLRELGAEPRNITVAIPAHPARPDWRLADEVERGVRFAALPVEEQYKARLLQSGWAASLLKERFGAGAEICQSEETAALNAALEAHFADGFQVRLKRVFEAHLGAGAHSRRVVAKSVGWGWLGYHAWIAGMRLGDWVPRPLALRDGMLLSEWVEGPSLAARKGDPERVAAALGAYVAERVRRLPLGSDPSFDSPAYRWCGWDDLTAVLSGVYGRYIGRLKARTIRKRLRRYASPRPMLVDGNMKPVDWVSSGGGLTKTDFEQHNFGGGERDLADSAWDLAAAIFEFELSEQAEQRLIESYIGNSGDAGVADRLLLHKILYALVVRRAAAYWIGRMPAGEHREECNRRYNAASDFAAFHLARYCGRGLGAMPAGWTRRLFFLDLDGVLDWSFFGFPHTTGSGLRALQLLRSAGFSVVLDTARSLAHVREYCDAYRLPGGIAELGSVFWDATQGQSIVLVDPAAAGQLSRASLAIQELPGVFVDAGTVASVRAYRYASGGTRALGNEEVREVLERAGCDRLAFSQSAADTYIIQQGRGKGAALREVQAYLGCSGEQVVAMGDSDRDLDMLAAAHPAYAPANASAGVRELVRRGQCRRTRGSLQAGLLEAARELCGGEGRAPKRAAASDSLIETLLRVPDRGKFQRMFDALRWGAL